MKKPTPFGKYYLLERINVGGMAEVFRAKAFGVEGFERLVAVKRILPNIAEDKEFIRMFIEEAKLAVQLNHANIAQIFDLGVVDGSYYIALEHVHGRDLRGMFDRCRQLGEPMPVSQACFVVMKVCEGLDYAHNKRDQAGRELHLVHRDVSPQNILVSFEGEVKLIDFGIAKAAGKGSKTQAGILKGKFGYMSPEQVRGIPIDRRSDVFSCGIVLYELLTGERLFVGESDFSTLEKVRNVEILPPSTYNRRIPDELERIVLKALAKDPEERYQNAIDLHDELQAFVYTAGEFYSRKDLAGWMKKTFGREIEEETAKLESYRQLKPPTSIEPQAPPAVARTSTGSRQPTGPATAPIRRSTQGLAAVKPPPPPSVRLSQQMPAVAPPPPIATKKPRTSDSGELAWDDDELETQIYDNPEDDPKLRRSTRSVAVPLSPPVSAAPEAAGSPPPSVPPAPPPGPDLSSLVSTGRGWEAPVGHPPTNGTNGTPALAAGSQKVPAPPPVDDPFAALVATSTARESGPVRAASPLPDAGPGMFDPMASFGQGVLRRDQRKGHGMLYLAVGGAAAAVVAVVVVIAMTRGHGSATPTAATGSAPAAAPQVPAGDPNTGFDLYVSPAGVTTWRLDGETRTDRLPSRIRGIAPGPHRVAIEAPPGFMSQDQTVTVEAGKAPKVEIVLQPVQGITGEFASTPPGAGVSLIVDGKRQELGASPASAPLDPRKSYQVLFEKPGYVSVNRPIVFTGALHERVAVTLEKAGPIAATGPDTHAATGPETHPATGPVTHPVEHHGASGGTPVTHAGGQSMTSGGHPESGGKLAGGGHAADGGGHAAEGGGHAADGGHPAVGHTGDTGAATAPRGNGTLLLGSKPPCEVYIDGKSTGAHTPHKFADVSAGHHRITLVNNEFGIKETFTVDIKPDQTVKQIKDYSDRLPK